MSITPHPFKRRDLLILIVILLVAAAARFYRLDISQYRYDQTKLVGMAQDLIAGTHFPTEGLPASLGFPSPPTMVFVMAVPYLISSDPLVAEGFIVLLNLVGVALLWLIAQRYFSRTAALVAGFGYACSSWAVQFSREIWSPNFNTPFIIAAFFCGLLGFVEGRRWAQILCLPLLFIAIEIHPNAVPLLAIYLWFLWRKHVSRKAVALSVVIALATLVPYFVGFTNARIDSFRATLTNDHGVPALNGTTAITILAHYASGSDIETALMPLDRVDTQQTPDFFWIIAAIPVIMGLIAIRRHPLALVVVLWALLSALVLTILPITPYPHYLVPSIPALFLLAGVGLDLRIRWRRIVLASWAAVLLIQCVLWIRFLNYVRVGITPAYGPLLADLLPIRQQLMSESDALIVGGVTGVSGYDVWSTMLFRSDACVRELVIADGGIAVLPNHPFSLLLAPDATPYEFADLYKVATRTVFPLRTGEGSYVLEQIEEPPVWAAPELTPIQPAHFDNGVVLNGYRFVDGRLYLDWSLTRAGTQDYKYFIHLLDKDGERIAQHDPSFYPGKYWCAGDRIITFFALQPPPETATLRIGMYRFENGNIAGSNVFDDAGRAAPWIDIPLTTG